MLENGLAFYKGLNTASTNAAIFLMTWQGDMERRAFAKLAGRYDAPLMKLNDFLCDGQSQAAAAFLAVPGPVYPIETVEHVGKIRFSNADACILDVHIALGFGLAQADRDSAARLRVLDAVRDEVDPHLMQQLVITRDKR